MNDCTPVMDLSAEIELLRERLAKLESKIQKRNEVPSMPDDDRHQRDDGNQARQISTDVPAVPSDSPFYGRERAQDVYSTFRDKRSRSYIGRTLRKRGGKELWELFLVAIDAGLLTPNDVRLSDKLTLRAIFPLVPIHGKSALASIDLGNERDRIRVRDEILPAMIANKDRLISDPDCLEDIIREDQQARARARREAIEQDRYQEATAKLPKNEVAVIMFGQRLWPRLNENYGIYDYDQLCTAIWYFRTQDAVLFRSAPDPRSRAIEIRHSTKWFDDYVSRNAPDVFRSRMRRVFQLVHTMTKLLEESPAAECRPPPFKQIEG